MSLSEGQVVLKGLILYNFHNGRMHQTVEIYSEDSPEITSHCVVTLEEDILSGLQNTKLLNRVELDSDYGLQIVDCDTNIETRHSWIDTSLIHEIFMQEMLLKWQAA